MKKLIILLYLVFCILSFADDFILVEGGTFSMGSTSGYDSELPIHDVMVYSFYISKYEVTFEQYDVFCNDTGREKPYDKRWGRGNRPVINVSWYDAVEYCNWLSEKEGLQKAYIIDKSRTDPNNENEYDQDEVKWLVTYNLNANGYRLPTEAEWEFAARGGNYSRGYVYSGSDDVADVAWYIDNSDIATHPVGQKNPNELGLYDMSGNVEEWCWDWRGYDYYTFSPLINPVGPLSGSYRVNRGGSIDMELWLRNANRYPGYPADDRDVFLGFRIVRTSFEGSAGNPGDLITRPLDTENTTESITVKYDFILVEGGTFNMGSNEDEADEQPIHNVTVNSFYISNYEVTVEQYDKFCKDTGRGMPSENDLGKGTMPVVNINWYDAIDYCNWLSEQEGLTPSYSGSGNTIRFNLDANGYRLPTEAEWEFAARGGNNSRSYRYSGSNNPDHVSWYLENSNREAHPVGQKNPNELGLYDMSGNVWEWCWDWYNEYYYSSSPSSNPEGPSSGVDRVETVEFINIPQNYNIVKI